MTFDDDVLSAIEEAFGADSASLMDELDGDAADDFSPEDFAGEASLEALVGQLDREILETVHKELGGSPQKLRTRSIEDKHVLVSLGESCLGFPMKNIVEIQQLPPVTYLPNLPAWIPGVCNLRGNIVSIVDIKQLLGFDASALGPKSRLVVVRTDSQDLTAGFVVDEIVGITEMDPARIRRPVGPMEGQIGPYLKGTYETPGGVICVLDLEATLNSPTLRMG